MIKKEELMLGNLVLYQDEPCRVTILSENGSIGVTDKRDATTVVQGKDLEPIPITTEILEANEFEDYGAGTYYFIDAEAEDSLSICIYNERGRWKTRIRNGYSFQRMHVEYIHDLQQALHLCKINKEIKL